MTQFKDITNIELMRIMTDARTSKLYLDEVAESTSERDPGDPIPHERRCMNILLNVKYLLENDPEFLAAFSKQDTKNTIGLFGTNLYDLGGNL